MSYFLNPFGISNIKHIVASNQCLANIARTLSIHPLFRIVQLQIHIAVKRNQHSLVLHAPLKFDDYCFVDQVDQEWSRVDRDRLLSGLLSGCSLSCSHF